ncbi:MAG: cbb3-type cytochrome c oxidase subunit I [Ginsengibacter sp.]
MKKFLLISSVVLTTTFLFPASLFSQTESGLAHPDGSGLGELLLIILLIAVTFLAAVLLYIRTASLRKFIKIRNEENKDFNPKRIVRNWDGEQVEKYLNYIKMKRTKGQNKGNIDTSLKALLFTIITSVISSDLFAQGRDADRSVFSEGGIIITLVLIFLPLLVIISLMIIKVNRMSKKVKAKRNLEDAVKLSAYLESLPEEEITEALLQRKESLEYQLSSDELSGNLPPDDSRGILKNVNERANIRFIEEKRKALDRPHVEPALSKMVIWYLVSATVWLIFGTTVGEYLGIKFVAPDADHVSWLSFGRLRPVHTNAVFWGWSSLAMMGLGYYVVPRVGNNKIHSLKLGWWSLWLINACVLFGSIALMMGINNSGGEFREYIWPIQLLFGIAVILTLINYIKTIAKRKTTEIYVSNWYIVAACMFGLVITVVAYLPFWQEGLGETITQGYYMHQGVGMWFMMFVLGLVYYFLPQQVNRPIYSYSLGILAFWSQILFYTVIGTHHFIFSSIPWSLQTIAIVGSVGMIIPVVAGTTNFLMTFKGSWHKLAGSYTLPFILVGIIFYFTGSMQGTAQAFRTTNLYWHFTDFTVAHSHLTMYGIIAFFLWGFIYAIIPRMTRQEPPQVTVGIHFWLALLGLMFYSVPLMIGGTIKGIMWMDGLPFIDSVVKMAPYWLWRAIGGSLMWASHLVFAYNMYKMIRPKTTVNINEEAMSLLETDPDAELIHIK